MTRAFATHELAARAWHALSPFPDERGLAARRFRELAHVVDSTGDEIGSTCTHVADAEHVLQTIGELALEHYHARAISAAIIRDRLRNIPSDDVARRVAALVATFAREHRMREA